jgi:TolB-like protein
MAAGITQELITNLGKMDPGRVGVLAGGAVVNYSFGGKLPHGEPAEPAADYVIEGTTRVQGSSARIAVQLVSVADQRYVWAESYDAKSSDALDVQQSVAEVVIRAVEEKLKPPNEARN